MEIVALGILLAAFNAYLVYQLGLIRSRLVKVEARENGTTDPKALAAAQEALDASHRAVEAASNAAASSQKAIDASQRALDASTTTASRLRLLPAVVPAPDVEPQLNAMRTYFEAKITDLSFWNSGMQSQIAANAEATTKLNSRIDNLSVAKGKIPDDMGL
jgi:hypothetical protein